MGIDRRAQPMMVYKHDDILTVQFRCQGPLVSRVHPIHTKLTIFERNIYVPTPETLCHTYGTHTSEKEIRRRGRGGK